MLLGGPLGPWQALLMSPKGQNASRDGFVNLNISLNSTASFGSLAPAGLALLFLAYKTLSIDRNHLEPANKNIQGVLGLRRSRLTLFRGYERAP